MNTTDYEWPILFTHLLILRGEKSARSWAIKNDICPQAIYTSARARTRKPSLGLIFKVSKVLDLSTDETIKTVWPWLLADAAE
jgi:hypothetical protein